MIVLPAESFDEIAIDLFLYAQSARNAAGAGEQIVARAGGPRVAPGLADMSRRLDSAAITAGQLYELFKALAPHEAEVRAFLANLPDRKVVPFEQRSA